MRSRSRGSGSVSNQFEQPPSPPPQKTETRQSVIGPSLQFVGEIRSAGSVTIDGQVKGKVSAHTLTVGRSGGIEGSTAAVTARIDGLIQGDLAADTVILGPSARVFGDITHRSLAMEPGARFEGRAVLAKSDKSRDEKTPQSAAPPETTAEKRSTSPN